MDYRRESDKNVFPSRELLKSKFDDGFFDIIDHFPLFASPQTILRFCKVYELVKDALEIPGDICEFGTWKGATSLFISKLINELEPQSKRKIIVFDNFDGLPAPNEKDGDFAKKQEGNYLGNKDSMLNLIKIYNLEHRFEIVEGDATKTIPEYFNENNPILVSLAYFDFDLYEPTKIAYQHIKKHLVKGSTLAFDEGLDRDLWIGECKVVREILNDQYFNGRITAIPNKISRQPEIILKLN